MSSSRIALGQDAAGRTLGQRYKPAISDTPSSLTNVKAIELILDQLSPLILFDKILAQASGRYWKVRRRLKR
ncbi:hypothetical protein J6590_045054 [Homalodisca vitripennis]|nr:hypothetical protein J6590_045054 [Homalodisca vitripennis]